MVRPDEVAGHLTVSTPTILMWVAIGIGVLFVGVMIFDYLKRKRRHHHHRRHHKGLGRALTRPFRRVQEFWLAMKDLRRQRARRKRWEEPSHHRTSNGARELKVRRRYRPG